MISFDPSLAASFAAPAAYGRGAAALGAGGSGSSTAPATGTGAAAPVGESAVVSLGQSDQAAGTDWQGGYGSLGRSAGARGNASGNGNKGQLSPDAQRQVEKLKETDRKVRAHEQAHMAAGGSLVQGGASYTYQKGPDGQMYAVGGEVSIDTSPGRTPEETLAKAQQVRAAALAPADPSPQDRRVAAAVARMESKARAEQAAQATQGDESAPAAAAGPVAGRGEAGGKDGGRTGEVSQEGGAPPAVADRGAASAITGYLGLAGRGANATVVASRINLFA